MAIKLPALFTGILLAGSAFAQSEHTGTYVMDKSFFQSRGAAYVPTGSYKDASGQIISVQAFFITNQVSNKEYRAFTDYVAAHPDSALYYIDIKKPAALPAEGEKPGKTRYVHKLPFRQIQSLLIDSLALAKQFPEGSESYTMHKNYFTDKKFENYPVVGVPYEAAKYYCIWKTTQENNNLKKTGKNLINDFRVPTREEFEYAQSLSQQTATASGEIAETNSGAPDKLGTHNLRSNVDEWTSSMDESGKNVVMHKAADNNEPEAAALSGFRMVCTYLGR